MGIKGLFSLINFYVGEKALETFNFEKDLYGRCVAVDANLIIHQIVIALRSTGKDLQNEKGEITSHLNGIFYKVLGFLRKGLIPVFVFDGKMPILKNKAMEKRVAIKEKAKKKLETCDKSSEEYIKNFKRTFDIKQNNIRESQKLLDIMGIPFIVSPGEADVICAWLSTRKINNHEYVAGVFSNDSDILAFGAPYLFRNVSKPKDKNIQAISLENILTNMDLTMDQFVDLCVLLGNDYCNNIRGIGPKMSYKLIHKHGNLKEIIESLKFKPSKKELKCIFESRDYFGNALEEIDDMQDFKITANHLKLKKFNKNKLIDFMCTKHGFDFKRINNSAIQIEKFHNELI